MLLDEHSLPFFALACFPATIIRVATVGTVANNQRMAKEDQNAKPAHARRVLLRPRIFEQVERLAERDESEVAEIVNRAVRELLTREGMWPPLNETEEEPA